MHCCRVGLTSTLALLTILGIGCGSDSDGSTSPTPSGDGGVESGLDAAADVVSETSADVQADVSNDADAADAEDVDAGDLTSIPDLSAPVTVTIDNNGIKHISGETDEDCYAGLGYVHARDRFFYMDYMRNYVRGTPESLPFTYTGLFEEIIQYQHFVTTRDGKRLDEAIWAKLSPSTKSLLEAYVRGVNTWIGEYRAQKPGIHIAEEVAQLNPNPFMPLEVRDWEPIDPVAMLLSEAQGETASLAQDLQNAQNAAVVPTELFQDLFFRPSAVNEYVVPVTGLSFNPGAQLDHGLVLDQTKARNAKWLELFHEADSHTASLRAATELMGRPNASNNWAISANLIDPNSGARGLAANDPHGGIRFPIHMYPVEIDAKTNGTGTLHVTGDTMPGNPFFQLGHTEKVAWGLTTSLIDAIDYYEETLSPDGKSVLFNGQQVPIVEKTWSLTLSNGTTDSAVVRWVPHHGPIVAYDLAAQTAVSVRWSGHEGPIDADGMFDLMRAQDINEAVAAVRKVTGIGNNFSIADSEGHVAWRAGALIPKRPWASQYPPYFPLPGDGSAEWDGFMGVGEHPELVDPPQGFVATANNDFTDAWYDGDPTNEGRYIQDRPYNNFRARRIREMIEQNAGSITKETMHAMQHDTFLWYAEQLLPTVLADAQVRIDDLDDDGKRILDALTGWAYTCPTGLEGVEPTSPASSDATQSAEAIGCTAFHVMGADMSNLLFNPKLAAAGFGPTGGLISTDLLYLAVLEPERLAHGTGIWDDPNTADEESRADVIVAAFNAAGARLAQELGTNIDGWRWGNAQSLKPGPAFIPTNSINAIGPFATAGGMESVGLMATVPIDQNNAGLWHAAMTRKVDVLSPQDSEMFIELPGGVEGYPSSPYYDNLFEKYLTQTPSRVAFGQAQLASDIADTFVLVP